MYSDLINLEIIQMFDDKDVEKFIKDKKTELIQIGFHHMLYKKFKFDEDFYQQLNIPFNNRWDMFKINRNKETEIELFKKYNIEENNYVFLHDDASRKYNIDRNYIVNNNLQIITPISGYTDNMLDYCYIMENAKELHFMDSSFRLLFDSLEDKKQLSYYHTYVRGKNNQNTSNSKKEYIIV
jgi:plasmid maintenance system killer protein